MASERKKSIISLLAANAIATAFSIGIVGTVDYNIEARLVNATYCPIKNAVTSQDAKRTIKFCVLTEGLPAEQRERVYAALDDASAMYEREFGIILERASTLETKMLSKPIFVKEVMNAMKAKADTPYDLPIVFSSQPYVLSQDHSQFAGMTNNHYRFVLIDEVQVLNDEELMHVIAHEVGHLFYARHVNDGKSVMGPSLRDESNAPRTSVGSIDDVTRATIQKYKWRIW